MTRCIAFSDASCAVVGVVSDGAFASSSCLLGLLRKSYRSMGHAEFGRVSRCVLTHDDTSSAYSVGR